jgi:hypothetical protein
MRTPLRLALAMRRALLAGFSGSEEPQSPVHCVRVPSHRPAPILSLKEGQVFFAESELPDRRRAPAAWVTGEGDPLDHPGISRATRELQESRRVVFLETDARHMRRRIHEFRPDARLYLTVRLYGDAPAHDLRIGQPGAFALAAEGVRAALLSGFLVCCHVVIDATTQTEDLQRLLGRVRDMDFDGAVITGAVTRNGDEKDGVRGKVSAAHALLGSHWWAAFSAHVERALVVAPQRVPVSGPLRLEQSAAGISGDEAVAP